MRCHDAYCTLPHSVEVTCIAALKAAIMGLFFRGGKLGVSAGKIHNTYLEVK